MAIREKALGSDHPNVATSLNNLAGLYDHQGQYADAEPLYKRSLAIREKALGPDHPDVANSLNDLAGLYRELGRYADAEPLYKRSLAIRQKALGPDHPHVAESLNSLAVLYDDQGRNADAEPLYKRSLAILEKALGPDHPNVATSLNNLAGLYRKQGQYAQALSMARKASAIYRNRIVAGGTDDRAVREASRNSAGFLDHLSLLARNPNQEPAAAITDEALQIVQLQQASGTASAIAKMAVRFSRGDDALATLIKRKQDAVDRRTKEEAQLVAAASQAPDKRKAGAEQALRDDLGALQTAIEATSTELTLRFPDYQELTRPEPLAVGALRPLLQPGEAMVVYALGKESFLWVVRPDGADFLPLTVDVQDVAAKVALIRSQMDVNDGSVKQVSIGVLNELYLQLFAPAVPKLAGVKHVLVVAAGPLQSLPLSMLVATPSPEIKSDADYRQVDWLIKHYAFSVLPSVSSIQAFRKFVKEGNVQEPFAGFGDPLIGDESGIARGTRPKVDLASVFRSANVRGNATTGAANSQVAIDIADVELIRRQERLPETADELRAMGKILNANPNSIWLRENATETRVKGMDLSRYKTIAFATHGVMAGEIDLGEPGLILTPPAQGTVEDDGYLSAGEIAMLKLNADWVVLSACNTASSDGTPGAESMSGLAKAFFYAGARSLLVSHWPVMSEATVPLTTEMLKEYEANPAEGKAEAQRKAMLALMATPAHPEYAHPLYWAPFVVVGEGGAAAQANRP